MEARLFGALATLTVFAGSLSVAHGDTKTWTGASSALWSDSANWTGGVPVAGDRIVFHEEAMNRSTINDLAPGTVFFDITFFGTGYTVAGNDLGLSGGILNYGVNTVAAGLSLLSSQTFNGSQALFVTPPMITGEVDLGSNNLTLINVRISGPIVGPGTVTVAGGAGGGAVLEGISTYTGPTTVSGELEVTGAITSSVAVGGQLSGTGQVGTVVTQANSGVSPGTLRGGTPGRLTTL